MSKPSVNTKPIADGYSGPEERIIEFSSGKPGGPGGLMSLRRTETGKLQISLYRLDDDVEILISEGSAVYMSGERISPPQG